MPETGKRNDPYRGYNFAVQIDKVTVAGFRECSGLTFNTDAVDYREGTDKQLHVRKLTGLRKFANIMLKRGITQNKDLWNWYKQILNGKADRRDGTIVLRNEEHQKVLSWHFTGGFIAKWEGPMHNATNNEVALESIEICVERVELE